MCHSCQQLIQLIIWMFWFIICLDRAFFCLMDWHLLTAAAAPVWRMIPTILLPAHRLVIKVRYLLDKRSWLPVSQLLSVSPFSNSKPFEFLKSSFSLFLALRLMFTCVSIARFYSLQFPGAVPLCSVTDLLVFITQNNSWIIHCRLAASMFHLPFSTSSSSLSTLQCPTFCSNFVSSNH